MRGVMEVVESGFKETEIGLIPEDWEVVRLGEVVDLDRGISWRKFEEGNKDNGHLIISIPNIKDGYIDFNSKYNHYLIKHIPKNKQIQLNDILFVGSSGSIENVGRNVFIENLPFEGIGFASFVFRARVKVNTIIPKFLYFMANSHWFNYKDYVRRSYDGKYNFQLTEFKSIKIPLPPLEEQRAIADILSTVQNAIEKTEKVINATKQLKKSMMKHLFTYGAVAVDEIDKVKLKESEIGLIPEHWEVVRLGEVADVKSGGTPSRDKKEYWEHETIPWIKSEKCQDSFITSPSEFITEEGLKNSSAKIFKPNTVLIAMVGATLGKTGYLTFEASTNQNVAGIIPKNSNLNSLYLFYCLQSGYKDFSKEGGYKIANISFIKSFPIPLPPLEEQQKIANILTTIDQKIQAEEKKKEALQNLFKTLLQQLMTGKIRVKKAKA
jgi:type I restriction enzyme S subunit